MKRLNKRRKKYQRNKREGKILFNREKALALFLFSL